MSVQVTPYLFNCLEQNAPKLAFAATDGEEWRTWRRMLRRKLRGLLAPWPRPVPLNPQIREIVDAGDHWRESILLSTHVNAEVPCYLLRPKSEGPFPVILALHGHGPGKDAVAGLVVYERMRPLQNSCRRRSRVGDGTRSHTCSV